MPVAEKIWGTAAVQECYDLVALLLMIRMNYHHQLIMNKRRIPCLDDYLDRVNLLLWPRFKVAACPHAAATLRAAHSLHTFWVTLLECG